MTPSLITHIEKYLRHLEDDRRRAQTTLSGYRGVLLQLAGRGGSLEPQTIADVINRAADGTPVAVTTRNHRLTVIQGFVRFLLKQGVLTRDVTETFAQAPVPRTKSVALAPEDIGRTLHVLHAVPPRWHEIRDNTIVRMLFYTGLRVSELQRLDIAQIDLERQVLRGVKRKGGGTVDVILNAGAVVALGAWLAVRPPCTRDAVFISNRRRRLSIRMIQKRFTALGEEAGLSVPLHPHALRHAHATALRDADVSSDLIRQSLNHRSLATTERYLHNDDRQLRAALERLPQLRPSEGPGYGEAMNEEEKRVRVRPVTTRETNLSVSMRAKPLLPVCDTFSRNDVVCRPT